MYPDMIASFQSPLSMLDYILLASSLAFLGVSVVHRIRCNELWRGGFVGEEKGWEQSNKGGDRYVG